MDYFVVVCCGYWQRLVIEKAKELGFKVIGIDSDSKALARDSCDVFIVANVRNPHECLMAVKDFHVMGCITTNDFAQQSVGLINEYFNLPGISYEQAVMTTNKMAMKSIYRKARCGFKIPAYSVSGVKKPISGSASIGVSKSNIPEEGYFIEEFIAGEEHTLEGYMWDGKFRALAFSNKKKFIEFQVSTAILYPPLDKKEKLEEVYGDYFKQFGINNCPIHAEIISDHLLEFASRTASGIGTHILPWLTGSDYLGNLIKLASGQEVDEMKPLPDRWALFHFFAPVGRIKEIKEPKNAEDWFIKVKVGDVVKAPSTDTSRVGHAIYLANSKEELNEKSSEVNQIIIV